CGIMNYRFVCETVNVFDELDDITSALKKAKETCAEHGCDLKKVLLSGGSAGTHLSLMYAYTKAQASPLKPVAAFCDCPPVDCTQPDFLMGISGEFEDWKNGVLSFCCSEKITKENLGGESAQKALAKISPRNYVSEKSVPTAVCQGLHDELVPYRQALVFVDVLKSFNIRHDLITYKNSGHALDKDPDAKAESKELMQKYIEDYL
ncbi:MAG: prolyl oligopeptidase family serine peptidase, partial [Clostridia bacterium]|nr:prolyl oligopeptidase family serine peptidase [Clostridia bacterium]